MKRTLIYIILLTFVFSVSAFPQLKKRIAVFNFEDKSDHSWRWYDNKSPGDGMADMLTTALVKSGKYVVIERSEIESIIDEQKLGQSGLVTEQSAAQMGKLLGVELAVIGAVTEFGGSKKDVGGRVKGFGLGIKNQKATVAVDVRLINTTTGEILSAESVRKEESAKGLSVSTPDFDFNNKSSFDNSLVGKATRKAVNKIVELIDANMDAVPWEGKVILVKGNDVYFKPGSNAGIKVGDNFYIYSKGEELIDPDTGLSLGSVDTRAGSIQVKSLLPNGKVAIASIQSGGGFNAGDFVRVK